MVELTTDNFAMVACIAAPLAFTLGWLYGRWRTRRRPQPACPPDLRIIVNTHDDTQRDFIEATAPGWRDVIEEPKRPRETYAKRIAAARAELVERYRAVRGDDPAEMDEQGAMCLAMLDKRRVATFDTEDDAWKTLDGLLIHDQSGLTPDERRVLEALLADGLTADEWTESTPNCKRGCKAGVVQPDNPLIGIDQIPPELRGPTDVCT